MNTYTLIDRVLSGTATAEEVARFEAWRSDPVNKEEYEDLKLLWEFSRDNATRRKNDPNFYDGLYRIKEMIESRKSFWSRIDWKSYLTMLALAISVTTLVYCCITYKAHGDVQQIILKDGKTVRELIVVLEKKYHVSIKTESTILLTCSFSGSFNSTATLTDVLNSLQKVSGLTYEQTDKKHYIIKGTGCSQ